MCYTDCRVCSAAIATATWLQASSVIKVVSLLSATPGLGVAPLSKGFTTSYYLETEAQEGSLT